MKIAITGGIGSGKSYICHLLNSYGITIYDCDAAAKRLMRGSDHLKEMLTRLIGPDTYHADGTLNKAEVAQFLLASEDNAKAIDDIVHPAVADDFKQCGLHWMECAILYESGFDRLVDKVIVVTAPQETRIQRIMQRDGISREKALEWMGRQLSQEEIRRRADFEIINDGTKDLNQQIEKIIKQCNRQF